MLVLSIVIFIAGLLSVCHSVVVYVDQSVTNDDCTATTITNPCNNLMASLEFIHATSTVAVYIAHGSYSLLPSEKLKFKSVSGVTISKLQGSNGTVHVKCVGVNAGLSFFDVNLIQIREIEFSGCGVIHSSTSRNFSVETSLSLLNSTVSLYFESCRNVHMSSVTVTYSLGIAVQFYSTTGINEINDCIFSNNPVNGNEGGGLYIEFPYCIPGDNTCDHHSTSVVDIASVSDSVYTISDCTFQNNTANSEDIGRSVLPYQSYHEATGRGGGLSIFFKGNANNNSLNILNCTFEKNKAVYGAGMYVEMQDLSKGNKITTNSLKFLSNNASVDGGGMLASYIFLKAQINNEVSGGSIILKDSRFEENYVPSGKGGGVSFTTTRQTDSNWNSFSVINTTFVGNTAFLGSAIQIGAYATEMNGNLYPVQICNLTVNNNYIGNNHNKLGTGAMFVQSVPIDFSGIIEFTSNTKGSGLTAYQSYINVNKNTLMLFQDNIGHNGGALSLHDSTIVVNEGCKFEFIENLAYLHGGAIYASFSGPDVQVMSQDCFIQYYDIRKDPMKWDANFFFLNNKMLENQANSIYSTSLKPCLFGRAYGVFPSENDHQKLQDLFGQVFCWNNHSTIWEYDGNSSVEGCKSQIDTGLNHFDTSSKAMQSIDIVPGQVTFLDLKGIGDQGEEIVSEIILHVHTTSEDIDIDSDYEYTSSKNIVLLKKNEHINHTYLHIETIGQEVPVVLKISAQILDCPPGFHLNDKGKCICLKDFRGIMKCDDSRFTAYLLSGFWMGMDNNGTVIVSHCRSCNTSLVQNGYYNLSEYSDYSSLGESLCGENREGVSCSTCADGYAPAINLDEFNCVKCNQKSKIGGVFLFLLLDVIVPLGVLVVVYVLDVPLTNGLLHGPIFFAQMITTVVSLDADGIIQYQDIVKDFNVYFEKIYVTLYDIFNLDFFMCFQSLCLGNVRYATIVSIHYASALLPLLFVLSFGLFIFLFDRTRRFRCINSLKNWMKSRLHNLPNILATCILLSYTKVMVITCYLLTPIVVIGADGKFNNYQHSVLYIDGSIPYPSKEYYPYLVAPIIVSLCFLIPVPIFLAVFRSNDASNNSGFFNNLFEQFQKEFRQSKEDFPMFNGSYVEMNESHSHNVSPEVEQRNKVTTFCDPYKGCGVEIDNRTEYECDCCSPQYLCRYYQKKSRYCPIAINTSCSFYDYRWFAGGFFALRVLLILPYMLAWTTMIRYSCQFCICMFGGMFIILVRPYKRKVYKYFDCNRVEALSLFNLGFILALCIYQYHYTTNMKTKHSLWAYVIQVFLVMVPFVWIVVVYVYLMKERHIEKYNKWIRPCLRWCCSTPDSRLSRVNSRSNNDLSERHNSGEQPASVRLIYSHNPSKSRSQTWSQSRRQKADYVPI